jgi:glycosyltransferase involved in cell wall biosynthesis
MARTPPLVSVIVPNYNSGHGLGAQLLALAGQGYAGNLEVIIPDNGSHDGSARAAIDWALDVTAVRVIDASGRRGPGAARNGGVRAARGDFLAFCDADDVASPTWLRELVRSSAGVDLVGGRLEGDRLNTEDVAFVWDGAATGLLVCAVAGRRPQALPR